MAEDVGGIQSMVALDDSALDAKLARLKASIGQLEAEMLILQREMQRGARDSRAMADTLDVLSAAYAHLTDRAAMTGTAASQVHAGMEGVGKASSSAAREMMVVGQHADDVQSKTTAAAEGMEKLGDATSRTAEEAARLSGLERGHRLAGKQMVNGAGEEIHAEKGQGAFDDPTARGEPRRRAARPLASLEDRLAHLTQVEQRGGGMIGGPDDGPATKAAAGDDPKLGKLQDIGKTLEEIRKLYADMRTIGVKRRR